MPRRLLADIALDTQTKGLEPVYTYRVPGVLEGDLSVGACVHAPFGKQEVVGYVMAIRQASDEAEDDPKLKEILAIVEGAITFNEEQAALALRLTEETLCELSSAIRCVAPPMMGAAVEVCVRLSAAPKLGAESARNHAQAKLIEALFSLGGTANREALRRAADLPSFTGAYSALRKQGTLIESRAVRRPRVQEKSLKAYVRAASSAEASLSPAALRVLGALNDLSGDSREPIAAQELLEVAQASPGVLKTLEARGLIEPARAVVGRVPYRTGGPRTTPPSLASQQADALERISRSIAGRENSTLLLHGVTASGKTEVYLGAIERALATGGTAMMLVPEIALTDQVVRVFVARFGEEVAVIHSRLSDGERHDEWRRLQTGAARIVVGARSAVFAPLRDIGLIAVDEEHESSYKQESSPRYHAARTAEWRAERFGATVVLGSATPSVETYHRTETRQIERIDMPNRIGERPLPEVRVIDMREELRARKALFSRELEDRMREALASKRQCILFLNRRGYSRFLLCRDCGEAIKCPNCAVSLTLHQNAHMLRCHHCAYGRRPPTVCPCCSGTRVLGFGLGTEKVEEEVNRLLPSARVLRMDRDTTTAKGSHGKLLGAFRSGQADVLIGTQMVAKGLDFSNVTVVGVVSADTSLHVPDFRAPERCFQLLTQVSGRAGRGDDPGVAVFQSFRPEHYAVSAAARHEYLAFYNSEIEFRRELRYPPFSRLAGFLCTGPTDADARRTSEALANGLRGVVGKAGEILGPSPAPLQRIKNRFRWRVALRLPVGAPMPDLCRRVLNQVPAAVRAATIADLDPQNMA